MPGNGGTGRTDGGSMSTVGMVCTVMYHRTSNIATLSLQLYNLPPATQDLKMVLHPTINRFMVSSCCAVRLFKSHSLTGMVRCVAQ